MPSTEIQTIIEEAANEGLNQLARLVPAAMRSLRELVETGESESVRLQAALAVIDRAGMTVDRKVRVEIGRTQEELDLEASKLLNQLQANATLAATKQLEREIVEEAEVVNYTPPMREEDTE